MRMRAERSGRDGPGPGPALRGGPSVSRERNFSDREEGRPMVISDQVGLPSEKGAASLS